MGKTAMIYWSGTGNTEEMANAILSGIKESGKEADIFTVSEISPSTAAEYDTLVLGCPAMGAEVLEESEFEPFFSELEGNISGKSVALFGSYGWGDGEWMRNWEERVKDAGASLIGGEGLIVNEAPDDSALDECKKFGAEAAK